MTKREITQDGINFHPISDENDVDAHRLLNQAAGGEIVLFAALKPHRAKLIAHKWVDAPKEARRRCGVFLVPLLPKYANALLLLGQADISSYPAIHPDEDTDTHPLRDHYYLMDESQKISREVVWFESDKVELEQSKSKEYGPRYEQIKAIVKHATALGYPLTSIPHGGKARIKAECLKSDAKIITESSFDHSWKRAAKDGLIEVANKGLYRKLT